MPEPNSKPPGTFIPAWAAGGIIAISITIGGALIGWGTVKEKTRDIDTLKNQLDDIKPTVKILQTEVPKIAQKMDRLEGQQQEMLVEQKVMSNTLKRIEAKI